MKQSELADKAVVSVSFLCHIENDKREASPALVRRIAEALDIPIEVVLWNALEIPPNLEQDERDAFEIAKSIAGKYIGR